MLLLLLSTLAFAQEPPVGIAEPSEAMARTSKRGRGARRSDRTDWNTQLYARPAMGGSSYTSGDQTFSALSVGGEGGLRYWERGKPRPRLRGRTRARLEYVMSTGNVEGMESKLGSFIGPWWKYAGITTGVDVFWNRYKWGDQVLEPTVGAGVPLILTVGLSALSVYGGIEPAYIANEQRRVDWEQVDEFGFGHQFSTMTGVNVAIADINLGVGYTRSITVGGVHSAYGISMMLRG